MKLKRNTLPLLFAACATAFALSSCEDDDIQIDPSTGNQQGTVDQGESDSKAILYSEYSSANGIVMFNIGDPTDETLKPEDTGRTDQVKIVLPKVLDEDVIIRVGMADKEHTYNYVSEYSKNGLGYKLNLSYNNDNILIDGNNEKIITIQAGQTESETFPIEFIRDGLISNVSYLFPIELTNASTGEVYSRTDYFVTPISYSGIIGKRPAIFIGYIDTEYVSPLIADKFTYELATDDFNTGEHNIIYRGPLLDILNIRTASIKTDASGMPKISMTSDLEYILKNRAKYIRPLQKGGLKVCLCIRGGDMGLGFSNMTGPQIANFVDNAKVIIDIYGLDGINLWDTNTGYDKEGAAPTSGEAFAKLIKAMKEAMPDKLLTLVDTRETTEALCDPQAGISVGDYLDYAWSDLEEYTLPYGDDSNARPLSGVNENKYGSLFIRDICKMSEDDQMKLQTHPVIGEYLMMMRFTPMSGTDVFVLHDIPYRDYGTEGAWSQTTTIWEQTKYINPEDFSSFTMGQVITPAYMNQIYHSFKKDW